MRKMNIALIPQEDLLFMISGAIKAPSGHNTQPWLFKIGDTSIEVHPNLDKSLPIVDPDNKELFISLGCAIENLQIAASVKGYVCDISVSNKGITTIHLSEGEGDKSLYSQINLRQTNRRVYNGALINDSVIQNLCNTTSVNGVHVHCYKQGTPEFIEISDSILQGNTIQMNDHLFLTELKSWMRYNKHEATSKRDGLSYAVFGAPNLPQWLSKSIISSVLNGQQQNKSDRKKIRSSSHFVLFTTEGNAIKDWINIGLYLQRFMLTCTKIGIACAFLNPPCELKELSVELAKLLNIPNERPAIILRIGFAKLMPYSLRKDIKEVLSHLPPSPPSPLQSPHSIEENG